MDCRPGLHPDQETALEMTIEKLRSTQGIASVFASGGNKMSEEKMSLIDELQNPPRIDDGHLDEDMVIDLMRVAADALSTMIGVAAKAISQCPQDREEATNG